MKRALIRNTARIAGTALLTLLSACSTTRGGMAVPREANEPLVKGPAVMDVVTPFDRALSCLDGRINKEALRFSVGAIVDATGKEQVTDGGSGKFVTQGAGDIVQSALFLAGATVVNRRDPRVIENEVKWGLLDTKKQEFSTFFITGSINSLDFLPGSGFDVQIAGVGPRYRQNRILVGLDLSLTETRSGKIVANVPLQKQVVATEDGFGVGRFFGNTLISLDVGGKEREALNLVLRQMLNLATFELLTQVMNPAKYADCMVLVDQVDGVTDNSVSKRKLRQYLAEQDKAARLAQNKSVKPAQVQGNEMLDAAIKAREAARPQAVATAGNVPAPNAGAAPVAADPNAAAADQSAYFRDEQGELSPAAQKALELRGGRVAQAAPSTGETSQGGAALLAASLAANRKPPANAIEPAACVFPAGEFPQVTPLRATEPGNSLRVRSRSAQVLCLADASGRFEPRTLVAGTEQQFKGRPPWRLQAERMHDLEIVFQGLPLRKPSYIKDRMELLERS
jgi:curli biogenesis system outer membrane secretion channel CsgG